MSVISNLASVSHSGTTGATNTTGLLGRIWNATCAVARALTTRRSLEYLDDRMLADLGISRAQAQFELSRSALEVASYQARWDGR
jgi:uncharacterized protein YjiS (DUF1127 family)